MLSIDYRRALECRFLAAANDTIDAFTWVLEQTESLGVDTQGLTVAGGRWQVAGGRWQVAVPAAKLGSRRGVVRASHLSGPYQGLGAALPGNGSSLPAVSVL